MGVTNEKWGVCGFTSCFYAMHQLLNGKGSEFINATRAFNVLAEIRCFLLQLKAEGKVGLLKEIENFTRAFGGKFADFSVDDYIRRIVAAANQSDDDIKKEPRYGIAMPPEAVAEYLRHGWGHDADVKKLWLWDSGEDGIIGMVKKGPVLYGGLCHYMYRVNGQIYSWGQVFPSVRAAAKAGAEGVDWSVGWVIAIKVKST